MIIFLIRYLMITLCINYSYHKLLNKNKGIQQIFSPMLVIISLTLGSIFYI